MAPSAVSGIAANRDLLQKFKVLKFLGKGSYGSVYKVQRLSDGQVYALKETDVRSMSQQEKADAVNEIRLLASVSHPNVVRYYEAFIDGNRLCIIMEYAPGGDLAKLVKKASASKKQIPEPTLWKYFIQVVQGLQQLHNLKILHRDIKPGNILITESDVVKIADLGIAKVLKHTMAKTQIGTPHYMPPEIWKNRPYSFSSDSWALGCILYEMCTFRVPFEARSMSELRYKVLRGRYPPIDSTYSQEVNNVLRLLMNPNPDVRPTMDALMSMPSICNRLNLLPSDTRGPPPPTAGVNVLDTIKVPRNLKLLQNNLPPSMYDEDIAENGTDEVHMQHDHLPQGKFAPIPERGEAPPVRAHPARDRNDRGPPHPMHDEQPPPWHKQQQQQQQRDDRGMRGGPPARVQSGRDRGRIVSGRDGRGRGADGRDGRGVDGTPQQQRAHNMRNAEARNGSPGGPNLPAIPGRRPSEFTKPGQRAHLNSPHLNYPVSAQVHYGRRAGQQGGAAQYDHFSNRLIPPGSNDPGAEQIPAGMMSPGAYPGAPRVSKYGPAGPAIRAAAAADVRDGPGNYGPRSRFGPGPGPAGAPRPIGGNPVTGVGYEPQQGPRNGYDPSPARLYQQYKERYEQSRWGNGKPPWC